MEMKTVREGWTGAVLCRLPSIGHGQQEGKGEVKETDQKNFHKDVGWLSGTPTLE